MLANCWAGGNCVFGGAVRGAHPPLWERFKLDSRAIFGSPALDGHAGRAAARQAQQKEDRRGASSVQFRAGRNSANKWVEI